MKKFCIKNIIIFFIIILTFLGCTKSKEIELDSTNYPQLTEQPFFASTQVLSGGDGLNNLNLADIKVENLEDGKAMITLSFMSGLGDSIADQQVSAGVPEYTISKIMGVDRMVVKLEGMTNWTYRIYDEEVLNNKVINGLLKQEPTNSDSFYLYISTKDDYTYRVDTKENKIIITLSHIDKIESYKYYVKINAFVQYQNGDFINEEFYPCLSNDRINGVLLSKPFNSLEEAQEYLENKQEEIGFAKLAQDSSIIYLGNNELPEYNYENQLERIINNPIGIKNNEYITGELLITEGRFLAWSNGSEEFVYAKPYTMLGSQQGDVFLYEEIWVRTDQGDFRLLDQIYTSVLSARYSYDNKFIAFIDQNDETRMLQIVNTSTGNVYIPADAGFGIDTSSFVWASNDNRLFAITGERESKQLLYYDIRDASNPQIYTLAEEEYMESSLSLYDEDIYYLKADADNLKTSIYRANIESGHAYKLMQGNSFTLSPDGNYMAVNDMQYDNVEDYSFYIYDTKLKTKQIVEAGKMIMDYTWTINNSGVYYTTYKNAGWEEEYPLELYYYDIENSQSYYVMDMITGALYPAYNDEQILVMSIFQLQDKQITITYQIK